MARRYQPRVSVVIFLLLSGCRGESPRVASGAEIHGTVVRVYDGDTIDVRQGGITVVPLRVRLYGIDAPERYQPYSNKARLLCSELAFGQRVRVKVVSYDRYQRVVGWVWLPDGRCLNEEMVRAGLAWWYRHFAESVSTLRDLEREARRGQRGLWRDPDPVAPWELRRSEREELRPRGATPDRRRSAPAGHSGS